MAGPPRPAGGDRPPMALLSGSHPLVRRLLALDRAYPAFEGQALREEVERNYRWNLGFNIAEVALFFLGASFVASTTILPLFISKLTSSTLAVGAVALLAQGGWYLPQLFTARLTERAPRMLPIVVNIGLFSERLPLFVLALAAWVAVDAPAAALVLALWAYAWHTLGAGAIGPAWQGLVTRCFPVDRRGLFMGVGSFVGTACGAAGAAASAALLARLPYPANFTAVFAIGATFILFSLVFLAQVREPVPAERPPAQSSQAFWQGVRQIVRDEHNFRWYLIARLTMGLGGMGLGFVTLSALRVWSVSDATVGVYTALNLVGQAAGMLTLGLLADRRGHKLSLELATLAASAACGLIIWSPGPQVYLAAFVLIGFGLGGLINSGIMLTLEFAPPGRQPTYAGLVNTGLGLTGLAAPLAGAWLAARSFDLLFGAALLFNLAALGVLRLRVRDPRFTLTPDPFAQRESGPG